MFTSIITIVAVVALVSSTIAYLYTGRETVKAVASTMTPSAEAKDYGMSVLMSTGRQYKLYAIAATMQISAAYLAISLLGFGYGLLAYAGYYIAAQAVGAYLAYRIMQPVVA